MLLELDEFQNLNFNIHILKYRYVHMPTYRYDIMEVSTFQYIVLVSDVVNISK